MRSIHVVLLSCAILFPAHLAAEEPRMVIVQPGYPGSTRDAEGFVAKLCEYVGEKAAMKGLAGAYYNESKPALAALEGDASAGKARPAFAIVSLGFYLEHRARFGMKALLQTRPGDNIVIVARKGDVKSPADLKGEPVAGGPLHEASYLERIAFQGKAEVGAWDPKPTLYASRALRDLADKKKYRAVALTGRDAKALDELYRSKNLEKILESEYYPPALLVALEVKPGDGGGAAGGNGADRNGKSEEFIRRISTAFAGLSSDPRGKEILETMGAEGFEPIPGDAFKKLEGTYDARAEGKRGSEGPGKG